MKQSSCAYISPTPACAVDFLEPNGGKVCMQKRVSSEKGAEHLLGH